MTRRGDLSAYYSWCDFKMGLVLCRLGWGFIAFHVCCGWSEEALYCKAPGKKYLGENFWHKGMLHWMIAWQNLARLFSTWWMKPFIVLLLVTATLLTRENDEVRLSLTCVHHWSNAFVYVLHYILTTRDFRGLEHFKSDKTSLYWMDKCESIKGHKSSCI